MHSPWKNITDTQAFVQYKRHRLLAEACKKYPELSEGKLSVDTQRHILVNEKQKLLYCFVPKVGCSNWKRVMMKLAGTTSKKLSRITSQDAHAKNGLRNLLNYEQNERRTILATYTAFMYARDPFARIVSAYQNKFGDVSVYRKETLIHKTAKMMIKKYRRDPSPKELETGENVTWTEFVNFLTDPVKNYFNEHWREMYKLCSPCHVNYDFLGHLETLDDDVQYMFQELHLEDKIKYPSSKTSHPTNSTNTYLEFYSQLTTEQIQRLWKIYEKDFDLFGYKKPNFVSST
ncbi:Carbohydrate sulfotransferase 11 [Holothuria leucospilota]|uniref:Carbohydrate sulfotransferase n=1 Tax=Holothuria leucospilota TaxID=206669 RepID=A0A9Q0YES3_HOLLE|nr:Carbohydrate sulfotransferase 11 [Holothuria leucospilota]